VGEDGRELRLGHRLLLAQLLHHERQVGATPNKESLENLAVTAVLVQEGLHPVGHELGVGGLLVDPAALEGVLHVDLCVGQEDLRVRHACG